MNKLQAAAELRRAIQLFAQSITVEAQMLEIASVYPEYQVNKAYAIKDIFRHGETANGDPQLYQVLSAHTSAEQWPPESTPSLYKAIGMTEDGTPEWVQPLGATDAYNKGDVVMYKGKKYRSLIDANVWAPDAYPAGWEEVAA